MAILMHTMFVFTELQVLILEMQFKTAWMILGILAVIERPIQMLKRDLSNKLEGNQLDFKKFEDYRTVEKPPKYKEKVEIETTLFDIQIKLHQLRQAPYVLPEGES
jgi:hypothetical protein